MEQLPFRVFVGVDWGDKEHQVCSLVDGKPEQRRFEHSGKGVRALVAWLMDICNRQPATMAIAIETPHGVLVEALLDHGFAVFAINPKQRHPQPARPDAARGHGARRERGPWSSA